MTLLTILVMLLPGLAWWAWLGQRGRDPLVALAKIAGISLAVIILVTEIGFLLRIRFSGWIIGLMLALCAGLAIIGLIRRKIQFSKDRFIQITIGLAMFAIVITWRLYQARDLLLPNWVDSQHHYLIIKTILENRGLPATLAPYLDQPIYYHYGFHATTALFTALSGLPIERAMLVFGQVLNATIALSIYALGRTLWEDWRPAAAAALLAAFVTRMPAYYLSWGRYTLTTGMILMPLAIALTIRLMKPSVHKPDTLTLALLTAGVLLSHYFTGLLLAFLLIILAVVFFLPRLKTLFTATAQTWRVGAGALLGLALAAPWLLRVVRFSSLNTGVQSNLPASISSVLESPETARYIWQLLGPASNHWLLLPAAAGLIWSLVRKERIAFGIWTILLALLTLPWSLTLKPFRPDHFAIVLFLPVILYAGWLFWRVGHLIAGWLKRRWVSLAFIGLCLTGFIIWSFPLSSDIVNPVTTLVTSDDLDALNWVREHTPKEARFFINTTYWQNGNYRGTDGGGWLLPYTGRWSLVPTIFYGFSPNKQTAQQLVDWGREANKITTCDDNFWALVEEADLDWIYLREGTGGLQPEGLNGCKGIAEAYSNKSVWVYQVSN
ncbi:hypothetical protein KQH50_01850 [bacterium]|nr:hypothetical protein [bacterium]